MPLDTSSLDSNAWLAGLIDTDGHFSINQSELNRVTKESNVPFMTQLAHFFQVNLNYKVENSPLFVFFIY